MIMEQWTTKRIIVVTLTIGTALYLVYIVPGAVGYVMGRVWDVVVLLILSTALAVMLAPPVELLCRLRVPVPERAKRMLAMLLVLALLLWLVWTLVALTAAQLLEQFELLIGMGKVWLGEAPAQLQSWLDARDLELPEGLEQQAAEALAGWTQGLLQYQFGFAKGALLRGWYLVELLLIPVLAFYFLVDSRSLRESFLAMTPSRFRAFADSVLSDTGILLHSYVRAQVLLCILKGVLVGLVLYLCGVKMYLTLALIAAVFRMAPVVGPIAAGLPCVAVPLLQNGLSTGLVVLVFYMALVILDGKLLTPIILADSATLHPVIVIISLLVGYEFMGVLGLLIAVPVAGVVRVIFVRYAEAFGESNGETEDGGTPASQQE